jgi:hypothetical protein
MYAVDSVEKNSLRSRQGRESSGWEHVGEAIGPGGVPNHLRLWGIDSAFDTP